KNVREAEQHGHRNALLLEIHGDVVQIDLVLRALLVRLYDDVAARIDVEEAATPALDIIEGARGVDAPGCGLRCRRRRFYDMCRHGRNNSRCALRTAFVHNGVARATARAPALPPAPLGKENLDRPASATPAVQLAPVQPARHAFPELDLLRREAKARPVRRPRHRCALETALELRDAP